MSLASEVSKGVLTSAEPLPLVASNVALEKHFIAQGERSRGGGGAAVGVERKKEY